MSDHWRLKEPVDALRGVAALGVATASWVGVTIWHDRWFAVNLLALADFILVIAGFIVARAHAVALRERRQIGRFTLSRLVRFMPLHLVCLALVLTVEMAVRGLVGQPLPEDVFGFLSSLLLMQLFVPQGLGWNAPAWIIAAELHMSILLAVLCAAGALATRRRRLVCLVILGGIVTCRIVLAGQIPPIADLLMRSVAAFMSGALVFFAINDHRISVGLRQLKKVWGGVVEAAVLAGSVLFVLIVPAPFDATAPGVFSCCLIVFLRRRAAFAVLLGQPLLQRFGNLSYPILLLHMALVTPFVILTEVLGRDHVAVPATLLTPVYFILLLWLSEQAVTYVEFPTRRAMWAWLDRRFPAQGRTAAQAAGPDVTG